MKTPNREEETEYLTPEEEAELEEHLAAYMTDGKLDWDKVTADSQPVDLDEWIAAEKARHNDD